MSIRKFSITVFLCLFAVFENNSTLASPDGGKASAEKCDSIDGIWRGHLTSDGSNRNLDADFKQTKNKIDGTISCADGSGKSKHYLKGEYLLDSGEFHLHDVGVDPGELNGSQQMKPIETYSLHLVEDGKKVVGTGQQGNKKLWIVLERPSAVINSTSPQAQSSALTSQNSSEKSSQSNLAQPNKVKAKITPEVVAYMTYVERTLKSHWHPSHSAKSRLVTVLFKIHEDGTVSDIRIDDKNESPMLDEHSEAALDAIKLSAPFQPLTTSLVRDLNDTVADIKFTFTYNATRRRTSVPMLLFGRGAILIPTSGQ